MDITLDQLLRARDRRQLRQQELLAIAAAHDGHAVATLMCLTVVMPGAEKRNNLSLTVARAAVDALLDALLGHLAFHETADLPTGFEAYFLVTLPPVEAKLLACRIEREHPLGRLFDIDVIAPNGVPVERQSVGQPPRKCLLCDNDARVCMRVHTHTQQQLLRHIRTLVSQYGANR